MRRSGEYRLLRQALGAYGRVLPVIIVLGTLSSAAEAVGIGLFLPLFQPTYLVQDSKTLPRGVMNHVFASVTTSYPQASRTSIIVTFILGALALKAAMSYSTGLLSAKKNLQIGHGLRSRVFAQLLNSGYAFVSRNEWGKLLEILSTETWRTTEACGAAISLITNACTVLVFVVLLLVLSWQLTFGVAVGMIILSVALRWIRRPVKRHGEKAVELNGKLGELMVDGILGVRTIEAFNLQDYMESRFNKASDQVRGALLSVEAWSGLVNPCAEISSSLLLLGLLLFSANLGTPWPVLLVTVMMIYRLQMPFKQLETARVNWAALHSAATGVFELVERTAPPERTAPMAGGGIPFRRLETSVVFNGVSFCYPGSEEPSLSKVSVRVPRGKVTALVGLSGAGKTTFLNLLCGLHRPSSGEIFIDGIGLREIDLQTWREHIALAGQDVHLFNTTVRENIRYGRLTATSVEILDAARKADADAFIRDLPLGYDTPVGDNGGRFSGGQRQRIALARAFLRNPDILILDEATNALDSLSEQWIQTVLGSFQDRCTIVIAAHRFSTIQHADQVIVLDGGRVVEQGSPASLRMQNGLFTRLYELQSLSIATEI
jgi:ATP-binding cassette, subfamily B, bacterial MsbA